MESSIAVFLLRQSACELLPTIPDARHLPIKVMGGSLPDFEPNMNESLLGQASRQASASWASLGQLFNKDSHLTKAEEVRRRRRRPSLILGTAPSNTRLNSISRSGPLTLMLPRR